MHAPHYCFRSYLSARHFFPSQVHEKLQKETIFHLSVRRDSHERVVDEGASSWPLQHVVEEVLDLAVALAGGGRGGSRSGGSGERSPQQAGAL